MIKSISQAKAAVRAVEASLEGQVSKLAILTKAQGIASKAGREYDIEILAIAKNRQLRRERGNQ